MTLSIILGLVLLGTIVGKERYERSLKSVVGDSTNVSNEAITEIPSVGQADNEQQGGESGDVAQHVVLTV